MRTFVAAAVTIALLALPAHAQGLGGKKRHASEPNAEQQKKKANDKAYKAALDKIPDQKQKPDPWADVRPAPAHR